MNILVVDNGNSTNNGVMAMAVALRQNLPDRFRFTVCLDNPQNEKKDMKRFLKDGIQTKPNLLGFMHASCRIKPLFLIYSLGWLIAQCFLPWIISSRYVKFRDYDVVISLCGEDFFSDNWRFSNCWFKLMQCVCSLMLNKKLAVLAQTFGPFRRWWSRNMASYCLKNACLVTARGKDSYNEVVELIGKQDHVYETKDLAFLLDPTDWATVSKQHTETTSLPESFAAVSVSKTFAVNALKTDDLAKVIPERFYEAMAGCLDNFCEATGIPVVFIPQVVVSKSNDDRHAAHEVRSRMRYRNTAVVFREDYTAGDLKAVVGRADIVVACRMHAQVAAVSQSIPTLALAYSPKSLDVIGVGFNYEYLLDVRRMHPMDFREKAAEYMKRLIENRESVHQDLVKTMPDTCEKSRKNITLLLSECCRNISCKEQAGGN